MLSAAPIIAAPLPISDAVVPLIHNLTVRIVREGIVGSLCGDPDVHPVECIGPDRDGGGIRFGFDPAGNYYEVSNGTVALGNGDIVLVLRRIAPNGSQEDVAQLYTHLCEAHPCLGGFYQFRYYGAEVVHLDVTNGRLWLVIESQSCTPQGCTNDSENPRGIVEIGGLPQMFDTLVTFIPGQPAMNILTPAMPDGFRHADSLQVWTGNVRSMPDWSQAQPLACMAAQNPAPGQLVSVQDTLPDPPLGEGRYYLVASQSGADRRLGRQYVNGAFSARQPVGLPGCQ
jgi:hypothetical protein